MDPSSTQAAIILAGLDTATTPIIVMTPELEIAYVNEASRQLMDVHLQAFRSLWPGLEPARLTGLKLDQLGAIPADYLDRLRDPSRLPYSRFVGVGSEKFHVTVNALRGPDRGLLGLSVEWWYATQYLKDQSDVSRLHEIVFHTNLLALNAAVEAARAGDKGTGFCLVAHQLGDLAQRSASAAREINGLITDGVNEVSELADQSGERLGSIVASVKKVSDIVAEIAVASEEQWTPGIERLDKAVSKMEQMTRRHAALVERAAASSESMDDQAQTLSDLMAFFDIGDQAVRPAAAERRGADRPWSTASPSAVPAPPTRKSATGRAGEDDVRDER